MNDDDPQDDAATSTLIRLARTLGVPVASFLTADPVGTSDIDIAVARMDRSAEVVALLRLFVRLNTPEARAHCLAYVVQEATHDG